jgi:hypothetical protein
MATEAEWRAAELQVCPQCKLYPGSCDWCDTCEIVLQRAQGTGDDGRRPGLEAATFANLDGVRVLILAHA